MAYCVEADTFYKHCRPSTSRGKLKTAMKLYIVDDFDEIAVKHLADANKEVVPPKRLQQIAVMIELFIEDETSQYLGLKIAVQFAKKVISVFVAACMVHNQQKLSPAKSNQ